MSVDEAWRASVTGRHVEELARTDPRAFHELVESARPAPGDDLVTVEAKRRLRDRLRAAALEG